MDRDEVWRNIHEQRRALAAILRELDDTEWATPSLCTGWTVREVAAHVMRSPAVTSREAIPALIRARGSYNRMVDDDARRAARRPVPDILADYERYDGSRRRPPGTSVVDPLMDVLVHTQDIVVPLGRAYSMPPPAAEAACRRAHRVRFLFGGWRDRSRLTIRATDADFSVGRGPAVEGPAQAVLMLLTGRTAAAVPRLVGPGLARLG